MMTNLSPTQNVANQPAANGLAIVRLTIGRMFLWAFLVAAGSGARIACARGGAGRSSVWRRRLASAALAVIAMVVT
jgi:hypothetical protein